MGTVLQPDDYEVGLVLTGHSSEKMNIQVPTPDGVELRSFEHRVYQHGLYRIKAIELPFLALECFWHEGGPQMCGMCHVDTRNHHFMKVSEDYVKAFPNILRLVEQANSQKTDLLKGFLEQVAKHGETGHKEES